jgi:hypothetical protein
MQDGRTTFAWEIAALSRQKKLPKLDRLLEKKKKVQSEAEIKQIFMGFKGQSVQREKK